MFEFLKKAFKGFGENVEEQSQAKPVEKPLEEKPVEKDVFKEVGKFLTETKLSEESFNKLFSDLEVELLKNNVAMEVVSGIKTALKWKLVENPIKRDEINTKVKDSLKEFISKIFEGVGGIDLRAKVKSKTPFVILFAGVNGVGKTTTMAKVANYLRTKGFSCVFAAADTFRAASIEQLQFHADKLNIHMIKHRYGADSAAVAYDAIEHAKAKSLNAVLIDTAGRSHANADLMDELEKVRRVAKPDMVVLVVDSLTGNDAVEQAKLFNNKIGVDACIIAKTDADEKGGALISVAYTIKKPILFLGTGQNYEDLKPFNAEEIINKLGL